MKSRTARRTDRRERDARVTRGQDARDTRGRGARTTRARGAVVIEFVFCLPILAFILALTFFFGYSMMNQQHTKAAARYTAWKHVRGPADATQAQLNQRFFADRATGVATDMSGGPRDVLDQYITAAADSGGDPEELARELVDNYLPRGSHAVVTADFVKPASAGGGVELWDRYQGAIQTKRAREGLEWRRGHAHPYSSIRNVFLQQMDDALGGISAPGTHFGLTLRQLYASPW